MLNGPRFIDIKSKHLRIFLGNLWKFSEKFGKCSETFVWLQDNIFKIFGNGRKSSEIHQTSLLVGLWNKEQYMVVWRYEIYLGVFKSISRSSSAPTRVSFLRATMYYPLFIPRACVGYEMVDSQRVEARSAELAITTSYTANASGIIVFIKITQKNRNISGPQLFSLTHISATIFVVNGIWARTPLPVNQSKLRKSKSKPLLTNLCDAHLWSESHCYSSSVHNRYPAIYVGCQD